MNSVLYRPFFIFRKLKQFISKHNIIYILHGISNRNRRVDVGRKPEHKACTQLHTIITAIGSALTLAN